MQDYFDDTSFRLNCLRANILEVSCNSNEGHIPSAFSILDILFCIYVLFPKQSEQNIFNNDQFILSKGHAAIGFYAILEEAGLIDSDWRQKYCDFGSDFGGHPDVNKVPHSGASTGSLGHGLPIAIGKILAKRNSMQDFRIFCLIGDGELNEGSNWEALLIAGHRKLEELVVIVDANNSSERALSLGDLESKFIAFDFHVAVINGHSHREILDALFLRNLGKPLAIIAKTEKGHGLPEMIGNPIWHHKSPTRDQVDSFVKDLM